MAAVAQVAPDGRAGAARPGTHDDPAGDGVVLQGQLPKDGLRDVVVATPVRGPLGVSELVHVVAVGRGRCCRRRGINFGGMLNQQARAAELFDQFDLLRAGGAGHDCDERQAQELGEVGFRDRGAAA
jgi:hypothetical protein